MARNKSVFSRFLPFLFDCVQIRATNKIFQVLLINFSILLLEDTICRKRLSEF